MAGVFGLVLWMAGSAAAQSVELGGPYTADEYGQVVMTMTPTTCTNSWYNYYLDSSTDGVNFTNFSSGWNWNGPTSINVNVGIDGPATRTIRARAVCLYQWTVSDTATLTITNVAPTVSEIAGSATTPTGVATAFAVTASDVAGDADPLIYTWAATGGPTIVGNGTANPTFSWPNPGTFTVTVGVSDSDGGNVTKTKQVDVLGPASGKSCTVKTTSGSVDSATGVEGSTSLVFVATCTPSVSSYSWSLSDGTTGTGNPLAAHVFGDNGTFTGTVTAFYSGSPVQGSSNVTISNANPAVKVPLARADAIKVNTEGTEMNFSVTGNDVAADIPLSYEWNMGDGTVYTVNASGESAVAHTYAEDGSYNINVKIFDKDGGSTNATEITQIVTNVVPVVTPLTPPTTATFQVPVALNVEVTDPGPQDNADTFDIDWTFTHTTSGTIQQFTDVGASYSWTPTLAGAWTVLIEANDGESTGTATYGVTVEAGAPDITAISPLSANETVGSATTTLTPTITFGGDPADLTWSWTVSLGSTYTHTSTSKAPAFTLEDNGTWNVSVTATAKDGKSDTYTTTLPVANVAPTLLTFVPPSGTVNEGSLQSGSATAQDAAGDPLSFLWNFGNGSTATGATAFFTWSDEGTFNVNVTVTDGDGGSVTSNNGVVTVVNVAPTLTAISGNVTSATEGSSRTYTVTASDPGTQDTVTNTWRVDGVTVGTGLSLNYTFPDNKSSYAITATATDNDGGTSAVQTVNVPVTNVAPTKPTVTGTLTINEGGSVSLTAASTDVAADTISYTWKEGATTVGSAAVLNKSYADNGTFALSVTASDEDGGTSTVTDVTVTVANVAPTVSTITGNLTGTEGVAQTFSVTTTDPGADVVTVSWTVDGQVVGAGPTLSWTPPDNKSYVVRATATDEDGGSNFREVTVLVANANPTVSAFTLPGTLVEGGTVSVSGSATDVATDTLTYSWNFGDGTGAFAGKDVSHVYADQGSFTVVLTVTDEDGGSSTRSGAIAVTNAPPVVSAIAGAADGTEGETLTYSVTATDVAADVLSYQWKVNGTNAGTSRELSFTFADDGAYSVEVTVNDGDGGVVVKTLSVLIDNADPVLSSSTVPGGGDEGSTLNFSALATDVAADPLTYRWNIDGKDYGTASFSWTAVESGTYTLTLEVEDDGDGILVKTFPIVIKNLAPVVDVTGDTEDVGNPTVDWSMTFTDAGVNDTHTVAWTFGDGGSQAGGATASHTYTSNGVWLVTASVTDDEGAVGTDSLQVTIDDVPGPIVTSFTGPGTGFEGSPLNFTCVGEDRALTGSLTTSFSFGDGGTATASPATYTWDDEGTFVVECKVVDGNGAAAVFQQNVVIDNVAPEMSGTPLTAGIATQVWSFTPTTVDPGDDVLVYTLDGPEGATVNAATGVVTWTPSHEQLGDATFTLTVDDGDEGTDSIDWVVTVVFLDADKDLMADQWEEANDLDPTDPLDALEDPDADGRNNLAEFLDGLDPHHYDGPGVPVLAEPLEGAEVESLTPTLKVTNAASPLDEPLTYTFFVYGDEGLTDLIATVVDVAEGEDTTTWVVDPALVENTTVWWTAAADDGLVMGAKALPFWFFVNATNEAPEAPSPSSPFNDSSVSTLLPTFEALIASETDVDGDAVTYSFVLADEQFNTITYTEGVEAVGLDVQWPGDIVLEDGKTYCWLVYAVDEHGLSSDASDWSCFFVNTNNQPPTAPVILTPADGTQVDDASPTVVAQNGLDPEGFATWHLFEVDVVNTFDSAAMESGTVASGQATTEWTPSGELPEDAWAFARVKATDGDVESAWATSTFFVSTVNDAPTTPALWEPGDLGTVGDPAIFEIVNATDPEGDVLVYDIVIKDGAGVTVHESLAIAEGSGGYTSATFEDIEPGEYEWTARAVDDGGQASGWAEPWAFEIQGAEVPSEGRDEPSTDGPTSWSDEAEQVSDTPPAGCACDQGSGGTTGLAGLLALPLLLARRRRVVAA
jgi:PKD repeat protein